MNNDDYFMGLYWKGTTLTAGEYLDKSFQYLNFLQKDIFKNKMKLVGDDGFVKLPDKRDDFNALTLPILYDTGALYYDKNGHSNDQILLDSICESGFSAEYIFEYEDTIATISILGGLYGKSLPEDGGAVPNSVVFSFPQGIKEFHNQSFIKNILLNSIDIWNPNVAYVTSSELLNTIEPDLIELYFGWFSYYRDIECKVFGSTPSKIEKIKNGTLILLTKEITDSSNKSHISTAKEFRELIIENRLHKWESFVSLKYND